jgi:hypothetical protein
VSTRLSHFGRKTFHRAACGSDSGWFLAGDLRWRRFRGVGIKNAFVFSDGKDFKDKSPSPINYQPSHQHMKNITALTCAVLPLLFAGCATPPPPQVFHNTDHSALVIKSLDNQKGQLVQPIVSPAEQNALLLEKARALPQHQTVVVILENYNEPQAGGEFRDRSMPWFIGLRGLGYEHIYFLHGNGAPSTDGLPVIARYD